MTTMQQPFAHQSERVVFVSPQPVEHEVGEIPEPDLTIIAEEFFDRVNRNPNITPQHYVAVADCLMSECHEDCRIDPLYHEPTSLPSLDHDQCDYFMEVAIVFARNIKGRAFADEAEAYLYAPPSGQVHDVMWTVLHS